ncbi:MAG: hypothetical protein IK139_07905, partial [Lachnospiraceae bacterium]|nr:hypothetical protein [Lachnospiraceae bacterium]
ALGGWSEYAYGVLDTETGKAALSDIFEEMIKAIEWIDNDTFMLADTLVDMKGACPSETGRSSAMTIRP